MQITQCGIYLVPSTCMGSHTNHFLQVITSLYSLINPDKQRHSHTYWMVACGVVGFLIILKAYVAYHLVIGLTSVFYHIIMALSVLARFALFWVFVAYCLIGGGICISGMVFFDKDGAKPGEKPYAHLEKQ